MKVQTTLAAVGIVLVGIAPSFASTNTLNGKYDPNNEAILIDQLMPKGFVMFNSYQHNPDGSAIVKALDKKAGGVESPSTITVSKDGVAVVVNNGVW